MSQRKTICTNLLISLKTSVERILILKCRQYKYISESSENTKNISKQTKGNKRASTLFSEFPL